MAERFVVRHTGNLSPAHHEHWKDSPDFAGMLEQAAEREGLYEKLGGGLTPDISEAVVVGWSPSVKRRWLTGRWAEGYYELVPVRVVPA